MSEDLITEIDRQLEYIEAASYGMPDQKTREISSTLRRCRAALQSGEAEPVVRPYAVKEYAPMCFGVQMASGYVIDLEDEYKAAFWADRLNEAYSRGFAAAPPPEPALVDNETPSGDTQPGLSLTDDRQEPALAEDVAGLDRDIEEHIGFLEANCKGDGMSAHLLRRVRPILARLQQQCPEWREALSSVPEGWPPTDDMIIRHEDMSPTGKLWIFRQDDGDMCLKITKGKTFEDFESADVEFCSVGSGGGKSKHTLAALRTLMMAMEKDNAERPIDCECCPLPAAPAPKDETP